MRPHFSVLSFNLTRILPFLLLPLLSIAQDRGVQFDHQSSWTAIQARAPLCKCELLLIFRHGRFLHT